MKYSRFASEIGDIIVAGDADGITQLLIDNGSQPIAIDDSWQHDEARFTDAKQQLNDYFARQRQQFDLRLNPTGTPFQQRAWQALQAIPFGHTRSYGQIAQALDSPTAARAVGLANNRNPIPIIIPCHRVVGADGSLTGYAYGLEVKRWLLALERGE